MKCFISLTFLLMVLFNTNAQDGYKIPETVNRVLFIGNSITYSGQYVNYVETYFKLNNPKRNVEFINVGLPSETVSGLSEANHADGRFPRPDLHERLDRIIAQTKPDIAFVCYGINDGIYEPFDNSRFKKYQEGMQWTYNKLEKASIPIIVITPPVYDIQGDPYVQVIETYAQWVTRRRELLNWKVIDVYSPMKLFLDEKRSTDPTFKLAHDGIHPNDLGHWIIAKQVLIFLGFDELEEAPDFNSAIANIKNGNAVFKLIEKKQSITKDAWLTTIGHSRPEMNEGIPLPDALIESKEINEQINMILNKK